MKNRLSVAIRSIALTCAAKSRIGGVLVILFLDGKKSRTIERFIVLSCIRLKIMVSATISEKPPEIWLTTLRTLISLSVKVKFHF